MKISAKVTEKTSSLPKIINRQISVNDEGGVNVFFISSYAVNLTKIHKILFALLSQYSGYGFHTKIYKGALLHCVVALRPR